MKIIKHWYLIVNGKEIKIPTKKLSIQMGKIVSSTNDVKFIERHLVWGDDPNLIFASNTKLIETNDFDRTNLIRYDKGD